MHWLKYCPKVKEEIEKLWPSSLQFEKQIKSVESVISHWSSHNQRRSKMPKIEIPEEFQPLTDALLNNGNTFYCKTELSALQTILKLAVHYNDIG